MSNKVGIYKNWIFSRRMNQLPISGNCARHGDNFLAVRIVCALLVIYGHAKAIAPTVGVDDLFLRLGFKFYSGDIAVDSFFFISGLMVAGSWIRRPNFYLFLRARFLRLVPAFLAHLILIAAVFGPTLSTLSLAAYFSDNSWIVYISTNIQLGYEMIWRLPGVFIANTKTATINGAQWTLPSEARAYVLLAIAGVLRALKHKTYGLITVVALIIVGAFGPDVFPFNPDAFRLMAFFALGVAVFLLQDCIELSAEGLIAVTILAYFFRASLVYPAIFALALGYWVLMIAYWLPPVTSRLEKFGDPSYGIYLWGWFAQQVVVQFVPNARLLLHCSVAMILAILAGYLSWHLIEKWPLKYK